MLYIYIATVVVMLGLILFTSLAILTISKTTCQNIKRKTLELTSFYDYLLEEHSQEIKNRKRIIQQLEQEQEELLHAVAVPTEPQAVQPAPHSAVGNVSTLQTIEKISKANYQSEDLAEAYQEIRSSFSSDISQVLTQIPTGALAQTQSESKAEQLLAVLSYETIYSMSFLAQDEQLECIRSVLPKEYASLLTAFLDENEMFSSLDFYTYLKEQAEQNNTKAIVYVSPNVAVDASCPLSVQVNDDICEGVQVEVNHMLYDFAIEKKEMGWVCQR